MMTGEQLGVGHEPQHGTPYVSSKLTMPDQTSLNCAPVTSHQIRNSR